MEFMAIIYTLCLTPHNRALIDRFPSSFFTNWKCLFYKKNLEKTAAFWREADVSIFRVIPDSIKFNEKSQLSWYLRPRCYNVNFGITLMVESFPFLLIYGRAPLEEMKGAPRYIAMVVRGKKNQYSKNNDCEMFWEDGDFSDETIVRRGSSKCASITFNNMRRLC